jgi:hypothetical protein
MLRAIAVVACLAVGVSGCGSENTEATSKGVPKKNSTVEPGVPVVDVKQASTDIDSKFTRVAASIESIQRVSAQLKIEYAFLACGPPHGESVTSVLSGFTQILQIDALVTEDEGGPNCMHPIFHRGQVMVPRNEEAIRVRVAPQSMPIADEFKRVIAEDIPECTGAIFEECPATYSRTAAVEE